MDHKARLQCDIELTRHRIIQLRLMLKHAKPGHPSDIAAVKSRLSAEINQLHRIVGPRKPIVRLRRHGAK
jgi:hypothetical protein